MVDFIQTLVGRIVVGIIIFVVGIAGGYFGRSGEVGTAQRDLSAATERSLSISKQLDRSLARVEQLEAIQRDRAEKIKQLNATIERYEEDVQFFIARARERDVVIARLEDRLGAVAAGQSTAAALAREGEQIVEALLD